MKPLTLVKDPAGRSATDLGTIRTQHPDLAKKADKAAVSLSKRGILGIRAEALLYIDHSGSMHADYKNGRVQALVERALGFTLAIDTDGTVPVVAWDTVLHPPVAVGTGNYRGVVDRSIWRPRQMGRTRLDLALLDVEQRAEKTGAPLFAVIVTDGNPDDKPAATRRVCDLARLPVFVKFAAVRDVPYLDDLDDLGPDRRLVDNVDTKKFPDLDAVSDLEFADAMADEWDTWIAAATAAGVIA